MSFTTPPHWPWRPNPPESKWASLCWTRQSCSSARQTKGSGCPARGMPWRNCPDWEQPWKEFSFQGKRYLIGSLPFYPLYIIGKPDQSQGHLKIELIFCLPLFSGHLMRTLGSTLKFSWNLPDQSPVGWHYWWHFHQHYMCQMHDLQQCPIHWLHAIPFFLIHIFC